MSADKTLKLKLKKIDALKYATIAAIIAVIITLIIFIPFLLIFSVLGFAANDSGLGAILGGGVFAIIFIPIFYGIGAFIFTYIITLITNFILKKTGGLTLDFEKTEIDTASTNKK